MIAPAAMDHELLRNNMSCSALDLWDDPNHSARRGSSKQHSLCALD